MFFPLLFSHRTFPPPATAQCLFVGGVPGKPNYLTLDACNATTTTASSRKPLQLSFRAQHNSLRARDLAVLTDGAVGGAHPLCMDADGMTEHLQMWDCMEGALATPPQPPQRDDAQQCCLG